MKVSVSEEPVVSVVAVVSTVGVVSVGVVSVGVVSVGGFCRPPGTSATVGTCGGGGGDCGFTGGLVGFAGAGGVAGGDGGADGGRGSGFGARGADAAPASTKPNASAQRQHTICAARLHVPLPTMRGHSAPGAPRRATAGRAGGLPAGPVPERARSDSAPHANHLRSRPMPIHLRCEPGDYADAVLLPGDPLRAKYIAETFFSEVREVNHERGMLGYTGTFEGKPISVQSSGMGCPSAAIVIEELIQLGVKRIVRVGTCGGLQADMQLGDLVIAISAVPSDATIMTYTGGEPHAPTADFEVVHAAVHQAKHDGQAVRVGPCVSSSTFYDPDTGRAQRWSDRGVLAVEMEAAALFTIAALRKISAGCLLTVSDIIVAGEFVRISDEELRAAVDRMTVLAIRAALA